MENPRKQHKRRFVFSKRYENVIKKDSFEENAEEETQDILDRLALKKYDQKDIKYEIRLLVSRVRALQNYLDIKKDKNV